LTAGNNVTFAFTGALSPVSARLEVQATLTPIAFLNVFAGVMIGTGYQMPWVLNTAGLLVETKQNLGYVKDLSLVDAGGWGSDHVEITVSPLFTFGLSDSSSLAVLFQIRRERLYDEPSIFANYFRN
jgi:hypothetical protein